MKTYIACIAVVFLLSACHTKKSDIERMASDKEACNYVGGNFIVKYDKFFGSYWSCELNKEQ